MAIVVSGLTQIAKKLTNLADTSLYFTWWKTNFNMPVPAIYSNLSTWTRFVGPFTYSGQAGSYSLSGFSPGFEVVVATGIWDWENTGGSPAAYSSNIYSRWTLPDSTTTMFQGINGTLVSGTLAAGGWYEYAYSINTGVDSDEISTNATYYHRIKATGTDTLSETTDGYAFTNVPNISALTLSSTKRGYMWVDGALLHYVDGGSDSGGGWNQAMSANFVSSSPGVSKAGYIWISTVDNRLHWVGTDGNEYRATWAKKQFASSFSNSSTGTAGGGVAGPGYIWVDTEFGTTHLGYIANDGFKYLTGSGDDPYV